MIFTGRLSLLSAASRGQSRHFMTSAISQRHTTLSFRIAGSGGEIFTKTYTSKKDFQLASYGANFTNPKTGFTYPASELLNQHRDPSVVYIARHPLLPARSEDYDLTQITDKAFEDEACRALEIYFQLHSQGTVRHNNPKRADGWRVITGDDGRDIVEWEGIWKSPNGHVYLLEAKHLVNFDKLEEIRGKLERSNIFLGVERPNVTVYVAGKHWKSGTSETARSQYGFGVLTSNGQDLTVLAPSLA